MALINCPECGKQISDKASSCPNCGFPITEYLQENINSHINQESIMNESTLEECPYCNYANKPNSKYCEGCGMRLTEYEHPKSDSLEINNSSDVQINIEKSKDIIPDSERKTRPYEIIGFILSIVSFILICISPVVGIVFGIIAIIMCVPGTRKTKGLSIAGLIIGIVALLLCLIMFAYENDQENDVQSSNDDQEIEYMEDNDEESTDESVDVEETLSDDVLSEEEINDIYLNVNVEPYIGRKISIELEVALENEYDESNVYLICGTERTETDIYGSTLVKYGDRDFTSRIGDIVEINGTITGLTEDEGNGQYILIEADSVKVTQQEQESKEDYIASCQEYNYKDVLRNPDDYVGKRIVVTVKISSVHNETLLNDTKYYFAYTNDKYDMWYGDEYGIFDYRGNDDFKILEDDVIKVYGEISEPQETKSLIVNSEELFCIDMKYAELISE